MINTTKFCKKCNLEKDMLDFHKCPKNADGRRGECKECKKKYDEQKWKKWASSSTETKRKIWRNWKSRNPEYYRNRWEHYEKTLKYRFSIWRSSAKEREISFELEFEDVESMPKVCHYTGMELTEKSHQPNTISLDRLDSNQGYTKGNVVFCCSWVNLMKHKLSYDQFVLACRMIIQHHDQKNIEVSLI